MRDLQQLARRAVTALDSVDPECHQWLKDCGLDRDMHAQMASLEGRLSPITVAEFEREVAKLRSKFALVKAAKRFML